MYMCVSVLQVTSAYSAAKDVFFSEISQVLSRAIRHVIVPPSASWHHYVSHWRYCLLYFICVSTSFVATTVTPMQHQVAAVMPQGPRECHLQRTTPDAVVYTGACRMFDATPDLLDCADDLT